MMKRLEIKCDYANIETKHGTTRLTVSLDNVDLDFLDQISENEILEGFDNRLLFDKLIENNGDILHEYLTSHGYLFNKA